MTDLAQEEVAKQLSLEGLVNDRLQVRPSGEQGIQCANEEIEAAHQHIDQSIVKAENWVLLKVPETFAALRNLLASEVYEKLSEHED